MDFNLLCQSVLQFVALEIIVMMVVVGCGLFLGGWSSFLLLWGVGQSHVDGIVVLLQNL